MCSPQAVVGGTFTTNVMCAAPITYSKQVLAENSTVRCVLINAGQANAATGEQVRVAYPSVFLSAFFCPHMPIWPGGVRAALFTVCGDMQEVEVLIARMYMFVEGAKQDLWNVTNQLYDTDALLVECLWKASKSTASLS